MTRMTEYSKECKFCNTQSREDHKVITEGGAILKAPLTPKTPSVSILLGAIVINHFFRKKQKCVFWGGRVIIIVRPYCKCLSMLCSPVVQTQPSDPMTELIF